MRTVHLVARDWHTGFVVPAKEICEQIPQLRQRFGDVSYLEFGWGDHRYYQSESCSLVAKLLAILIPSRSTLQVVAVTDHPQRFYSAEPIVKLLFEDSGFSALIQFISGSFDRNQHARLSMQSYGRCGDSQFYKARGLYHLFNTCNTWTAKGLYKAGVDIKPRLTFTAEDIMTIGARVSQSQSIL